MMKIITGGFLAVIAALFGSDLALTHAAISCGTNGAISMAGSSAVVPIAQAWAGAYTSACSGSSIAIADSSLESGGGSLIGAQRVCGVSTAGAAVDVGLLSRQFLKKEATATLGSWKYQCAQGVTSRTAISVEVAVDGLAFVSAINGIAAKCIATLAGRGLTFSQIRWMFSSFPLSKLKADSFFDPFAVPNSDKDDSTRLWSELCYGANCVCPATPIKIAGSPSSSGTFVFFLEKVLTQAVAGETIAFSRGYYSDSTDNAANVINYVTNHPEALAFTSFAPYNTNAKILYAASVQDPDDGVYRFPTFAQFSTGEYPASFRIFMQTRSDDATVFSRLQSFFVFAFSDQGDELVSTTGLLPIPATSKVQMLSRLGAPGGFSLNTVHQSCGPGSFIFGGGATTVFQQSQLWGFLYGDACGMAVKLLSGTSILGAGLACGVPDPVSLNVADYGTISRSFLATEAVLPAGGSGFDYKCLIGTKRTVRQVPTGLDGLTFSFPQNQVATKCVATLSGGGFTLNQLRWIFSSFTYAQLTANGWDKSSLPNSDGSDSTHLWSELGGSGCQAVEIAIGGYPSTTSSFALILSKLFSGAGETIALTRPLGYYFSPADNPNELVQWLQSNNNAIAFLAYPYYASNTKTLDIAPVKNSAGNFVLPSSSTLADSSYNPFTRLVYIEIPTTYLTFLKIAAWVKFGLYTQIGDSLTTLAGLTPIATATKANVLQRLTLKLPCFSEASTVEEMEKGVIAMTSLKIGDMVKDATGKFSRVYSFDHYAPETQTEYLQIHVTGLRAPLEISAEHMLLVNNAAVPASAVTVGDLLTLALAGANGLVPISLIKKVVRRGAYAPFTTSGTIAVNQVCCSSYVDLQNESGFLIIGGHKTPLTMQFLAHVFQAPHRLACTIAGIKYCQIETYDETGVSGWISSPHRIAEWLIKQKMVVMTIVLVPTFLIAYGVYFVEIAVTNIAFLYILVACTFYVLTTNLTVRLRSKQRKG